MTQCTFCPNKATLNVVFKKIKVEIPICQACKDRIMPQSEVKAEVGEFIEP